MIVVKYPSLESTIRFLRVDNPKATDACESGSRDLASRSHRYQALSLLSEKTVSEMLDSRTKLIAVGVYRS